MKWVEFMERASHLPVIDSELFFVGIEDPNSIRVQISRWQKQGKILQVKRGLYVLAAPYKKQEVYGPYLASVFKHPSYVSLEKALEYHGLIPEGVPVFTCVTTKRTGRFVTKLGIFDYKHVKTALFWGYQAVTVNKQTAFMALPEKALLDFFYLKGVKISFEYLGEMRLQNLGNIDLTRLLAFAERFNKPGMLTAAQTIKAYVEQEREGEKEL